MAVQVVAYELRLAMLAGGSAAGAERLDPLATVEDLERFYEHLERRWSMPVPQSGQPAPPDAAAAPAVQPGTSEEKEVRILRGILSALEPPRRASAMRRPPDALR
jgi:tRNA (cytidine32/uridine32-2'-O)-methyltransferase